MNQRILHALFALCLLMFYTSLVTAQATIGSAKAPESFSVLELTTTTTKGGLRLPHLTSTERDALSFVSGSNTVPNQGLTIYNTTTGCIEYWNNNKWASLCLGTANITLKSPCGDYDKNTPPIADADGTASNCLYTPEDTPACTVSSGKAYEVYLRAGNAYATLNADPLTSAFSITFTANNSNTVRNAVVRVTNNCSGEFEDFVFSQQGAVCPGVDDPVLNAGTLSLCDGSSVYAYVTSDKDRDYIWTYGGVVVHTGTHYEIKRSGTYKVYSGLLGCGTPASLIVTSNSGTSAPIALTISATNNGILCNGGNVILTANLNSPGDVIKWYHNGIPQGNANPLTVSGAASAGQWFAVVEDGECNSSSSNVITLSDQTTASEVLGAPLMLIDGADVSKGGTYTLCENSGVLLEVGNAATYPSSVLFEWFVNGQSLGIDTNPTKIYNVPSGSTSLVISVQVSNQGASCPNSAVAPTANITLKAPDKTNINNGAAKAYICGNTPALLVAGYQGGAVYEWRHNGKLISSVTAANYQANQQGSYTVRYQTSNGCWSRFSPAITVENSSAISIAWSIEPGGTTGDVIYGATESYSVATAPFAESYRWTAIGTTSGEIPMIPSGNGSAATINYPSLTYPATEEITISVEAKNGCGNTTIRKKVTLGSGCTPVNAVNITPNGAVLQLGTPNDNKTFTATAAEATNYQWKVDEKDVVGADQNSYTYTASAAGTFTISVTATGCGGTATASVDVLVKPDLGSITEEMSGNYTLDGKACYDVNQASSIECGLISNRIDDFASTKSFDYTFTTTTAYTDLEYYLEDNSTIVQKHTPNDNKLTVVYRDDINTYIKDHGTADLKIIAVYKNTANQWRKITREVKVQDCSCCGAYISATQWKAFSCHNLGADPTLNPFVPVKGIHGNYYQWGRATVVADASTAAGAIAGWNTTAVPNEAWSDTDKTANDPCPKGFRVPTISVWAAVVGQTTKNPQKSVGTWISDATNFGTGMFLGEGLFLPVAGFRQSSNGQLSYRGGSGYYWSSTVGGSLISNYLLIENGSASSMRAISRSYGMSVRCVAE